MFWKAGRVLYKKDIEGEGKFGLLKGAPGKVKVIHKSAEIVKLGGKIYVFYKCFRGTPKESEFALTSDIFFVEDCASFPKQLSDRR